MDRNERLTRIQEELNRNPFVTSTTLEKELSYSHQHIPRIIRELSEKGDKNAQLWVETASMRRYPKRFRNALKIFAYAFEQGLTIEDVERLDLRTRVYGHSENKSIFSILNFRTFHQSRLDKRLLNIKETAKELMKILGKYDLPCERIKDILGEYGIMLECSSTSQDKSRLISTTQHY